MVEIVVYWVVTPYSLMVDTNILEVSADSVFRVRLSRVKVRLVRLQRRWWPSESSVRRDQLEVTWTVMTACFYLLFPQQLRAFYYCCCHCHCHLHFFFHHPPSPPPSPSPPFLHHSHILLHLIIIIIIINHRGSLIVANSDSQCFSFLLFYHRVGT